MFNASQVSFRRKTAPGSSHSALVVTGLFSAFSFGIQGGGMPSENVNVGILVPTSCMNPCELARMLLRELQYSLFVLSYLVVTSCHENKEIHLYFAWQRATTFALLEECLNLGKENIFLCVFIPFNGFVRLVLGLFFDVSFSRSLNLKAILRIGNDYQPNHTHSVKISIFFVQIIWVLLSHIFFCLMMVITVSHLPFPLSSRKRSRSKKWEKKGNDIKDKIISKLDGYTLRVIKTDKFSFHFKVFQHANSPHSSLKLA